MSDDAAQPFSRRALIVLLAAGIVGLAAFLLLSAYAPDLRSGRDGGAHALSTAATGFKGLYDLNEAVDGTSTLLRSDDPGASRGLVILTPPPGIAPEKLAERIALFARISSEDDDEVPVATLIVLPKWRTTGDPEKRGWVRTLGTFPSNAIGAMLRRAVAGRIEVTQNLRTRPVRAAWPDHADIAFTLNGMTQSIAGEGLDPLIADPGGGAVLAQLRGRPVYILADPDLIDNRGLKDREAARSAIAMLDALSPDRAGLIAFDATLNGFARTPNLLKLAIEPPFAAVTICLFVAALLAGTHALARFGPPLGEARRIAFGKAALLDNTADLIRRAGHDHRGGERYIALVRDAVARAVGAPPDLAGERLDRYLERLIGPGGHQWADLANRVRAADSTAALLAAAQAMHQWRKDVTRDRG